MARNDAAKSTIVSLSACWGNSLSRALLPRGHGARGRRVAGRTLLAGPFGASHAHTVTTGQYIDIPLRESGPAGNTGSVLAPAGHHPDVALSVPDKRQNPSLLAQMRLDEAVSPKCR